MENAVRINLTPSQGYLFTVTCCHCSASIPLSESSVLLKIDGAGESSEGLVNPDSDSVGLGWDLRLCISSHFSIATLLLSKSLHFLLHRHVGSDTCVPPAFPRPTSLQIRMVNVSSTRDVLAQYHHTYFVGICPPSSPHMVLTAITSVAYE